MLSQCLKRIFLANILPYKNIYPSLPFKIITNSFFLSPTSPSEIASDISLLKNNKSEKYDGLCILTIKEIPNLLIILSYPIFLCFLTI